MAGFRRAKAEQAALKIGIYGKAGSGKTFTSLLIAEGLGVATKKRVAVVDTERGTDFYAQAVQERKVHPEAFDFDALYSRSMVEILSACTKLDPKTYGAVVLDSMTHLWNTCVDSYAGKKGPDGQIPINAWGTIKKPYKALMAWMLATPLHVIICGRLGIDYGPKIDGSDENEVKGYKMKAEGETGYEPHILIRMEEDRKKDKDSVITALVEKDRTGILQGRAIQWPNFDNVAKPLLRLLGDKQSSVDSEDAAMADAEAQAIEEARRKRESGAAAEEYKARMQLAKTKADLEAVAKELTPAKKKGMLTEDVAALRDAYQERTNQLSA